MKTITATTRGDRITHIEAPGCIINVHVGLTDTEGRSITSVEVLCDEYAGEPEWTIPDFPVDGSTRPRHGLHIRVREETNGPRPAEARADA